jgi:ParB-like nuclease domain
MSIPIIQKTDDYSIFKYIGFNREKNKNHIDSLKKILQKENLLHLHPILLNEKMEVVDGQHRLEAAKELGLEIFYIVSNLSYDHILNSNLFQKRLSLNDVIKFFSLKDKLPDYILLQDYITILSLNPKSIVGLIFGNSSRHIFDFIKKGSFKFPSDMKLIEKLTNSFLKFVNFCKEKRVAPFSMFSTSNFTISYRNLILLSNFNEEIFFSKLELRWFDLKPQLNAKEWTRQLIGIYNWKNQNPIHVNDQCE